MPPKGVILFNVSGTGKTFLAKAVANQTSTFLCVAGSELIQKYLGDGLKLVHELFRMAEEHMPVIGTKCYSLPDPTLIRPGRIDRKIEFPLPDVKTKLHFRLHTSQMSQSPDVDLLILTKVDLSGVKATFTEASDEG